MTENSRKYKKYTEKVLTKIQIYNTIKTTKEEKKKKQTTKNKYQEDSPMG